jgi:phytoene dehydrogenase-like protein
MAHHSIGNVGGGTLGGWGVPEGGMGAVAEALERSARSFGADVRTNARVERVLIRDGRTYGVALEGGEELHAPAVVTACHPKITFLRQIDRTELPGDFVRDIENWKTRSGVVKINCALSKLPRFSGAPDFTDLSGGIELAHSVEYLETAFEEARRGIPASRPFSDGVVWCRRCSTPRSLRRARTCCLCSRSGCPTSGRRSRIGRSWRPTRTG